MYELLLRFRDGQPTRGHVLDTPTSDARPIELADIPKEFPAAEAVAQSSKLLLENEMQARRIRSLESECDGLKQSLDARDKEAAELRNAVAAAEFKLSALTRTANRQG